VVDARERLQAMRVERLAQPRLDLVGIAAGGQLDHVRTLGAAARCGEVLSAFERIRFIPLG